MATPYLGFNTVLGLALEATPGTPEARTVWLPVVSASLQRVLGKDPVATLAYDGAVNRTRHHWHSDQGQGQVVVEPCFEGFGLLWKWWLGSASTGAASGGIYPHTYTQARTLPSATAELVLGDSGNSQVFAGAHCSKGELVIEIGKRALFSFDLLAYEPAAPGSAGTPTFTASLDLPMSAIEAGDLSWNSRTLSSDNIQKVTISLDNKIAARPRFGSRKSSRPTRTAASEVLITVECDYHTDNFEADWVSNSTADLTLTLTGTGSRTLVLTGSDAYISSHSRPLSGEGVVRCTLQFRCKGGTDALKLVANNTQSDATAA